MEDIATQLGLSVSSVSLVLRDRSGPSAETRRRVLEAADELGYRTDRAASLLRRRRSNMLGLMLDLRKPFHAELVEDVQDAADRRGFDLVLSTITRNRDEQSAVETLLDSRCEALILMGPEMPTATLVAIDRQIPMVVTGRPVPSRVVNVVRAADDKGTALAVDHLVDLGHRDIAYVDGGRTTISSIRRRGYAKAMKVHGLGSHLQVLSGDETEQAGVQAARSILDSPARPTAVVAFNDRSAAGVLDTLVRAGVSVPDDISVVGYDDSWLARLAHINLTTVSQNPGELTEQAVALLESRLESTVAGPHVERVVDPQLVIRGTTKPPREREQ